MKWNILTMWWGEVGKLYHTNNTHSYTKLQTQNSFEFASFVDVKRVLPNKYYVNR